MPEKVILHNILKPSLIPLSLELRILSLLDSLLCSPGLPKVSSLKVLLSSYYILENEIFRSRRSRRLRTCCCSAKDEAPGFLPPRRRGADRRAHQHQLQL
ncbi:hypothetical protein CDAR_298151 [Caerostris darwini]|uniref:Uncharacterized protein n=1 Tax=Caerostris darwini TaxID=1538125 RepID=A0AAV4Q0L4_9ARAC|nr:hypothetical protein CDAR_298151 [Caerostris darwini]